MSAYNPELSIIIVSYNTVEITKNCIESILKSVKDLINYEIIVIDNNSIDSSVGELTNYELKTKRIKLIKNKENVGFAKANNQGVKEAKGRYILFLNSDIVVLNDAIIKLLNYFKQSGDEIDFLGGKLYEKDSVTPQPSAGPFYTLPVIFAALFLKGDYWGLTRFSPTTTKEVDWISGACILTTKAKFDKIHGFDEKIFMYMDEIDMFYRAKKEKMRVFFYPESHFIHLASASSGGRTYPILQVYKGFLYFYKKHYSSPYIFFLKFLLKLKAFTALLVGKLTRSQYLIQTYEKALRITQKA
jgi:hypothetical protein